MSTKQPNDTIQLEEFVSSVLLQIIRATSNIQSEVRELRAYINPVVETSPRTLRSTTITMVEFDVGVTATTSGKTQSGIGILVAGVGLGTKGERVTTDSTVNRIRFSIPIELPSNDIKTK